jgi:predicted HTH transcriptional regulator
VKLPACKAVIACHETAQPMNKTALHTDQVLSLIQKREQEHIEFKRRVPTDYKMAREMAAMANTVGGNILIGVEDNGTVAGVADVRGEKAVVLAAARELCSPPLEPEIRTVALGGKTVLWIIIPSGGTKHVVIDAHGNVRFYVRVRDKNQLVSRQTARRLSEGPSIKLAEKNLDRHEKRFLEYLRTREKITLAQFCQAANISKRRAARICIKLEKAGLIRTHDFEREIFYTLNQRVPKERNNY